MSAGAPSRILVVMGVSGCGKTTVAEALAARLGWPFLEGDSLHPARNIARMRAGQPLDDLDRAPWLAALAAAVAAWRRADTGGVLSCSALRRRYRDTLRGGGGDLCFVHLASDAATLRARLAQRRGHFMPARLLDSQLAALEPPALDERAVTVNAGAPLPALLRLILAGAGLRGAPGA